MADLDVKDLELKDVSVEEEAQETRKLQLEDKILRYFQNKEIEKERKEENKLLFEEIEQFFEDSDEDDMVLQLPNGEFAVLSKRMSKTTSTKTRWPKSC